MNGLSKREEFWVPEFLQNVLSYDHFYDVASVDARDVTSEQMQLLQNFRRIRRFVLWDTFGSDPFDQSPLVPVDLSPLASLTTLENFAIFDVPGVDDRVMHSIGGMTRLRQL